MIKFIKSKLNGHSLKKSYEKAILDSKKEGVPALDVVVSDDRIATLFYDQNREKYGIVYYEKCNDYKGLLPFNIDLPKDESIKIGQPYYSQKLWQPFSARIPGKSREDCIEILRKNDLTLKDHPLKIINCIGRRSIANCWELKPYHS